MRALEAAALGVPAVVVSDGVGQLSNINGLARAGAARRATWATAQDQAQQLAGMAPAELEAMSRAGRRLVDGRGAMRVAEVLDSWF
jgi:UDP-N-acetylglucosamine:LPS N-acetylglucosamine transferase